MRDKKTRRLKRQIRTRVKICGTKQRPRLAVIRTLSNIFVQLVDDENHSTLLSASTLDKKLKGANVYGGNTKAADMLGGILAQRAKEKGISKVVFDRRDRPYHGRIKALAEAARKAGLEF
ncbi:MAG: 50S ribosomal protein L18 [Candidatus Omnitrophica bacterium]|nr:50S ribosomal protein L18 [Candidatus Omnitrophota bacterium]